MSEYSFAVKDREARIAGGRSFDRNKQAKYRFLTDTNGAPFNRGSTARRSLPGKSRIDREAEEEEFKNIDLSVPGTPVSSRHVMSLKYRNKLAEQDKEERERQFADQLSDEDPLKKFLESMRALNAKKSSESNIVVEVPQLKPVLQRRNSYGYNNIGTWNSSSNLQGYTVLFQRSMSAKVDYNQHSTDNSNLEIDTDQPDQNLMDMPDDKVDLVDKDNGVSEEDKPLAKLSHENENGDKEIEETEAVTSIVNVEPVKEIEKVEKVEVVQKEISSEKPKSKDKSKNRYVNFWRKLTGHSASKDHEKKVDRN